jgi:hypothetical protein
MTDVLLFVPGIMGSELWDGEGKVWPGSLTDGLFGYSDAKFERLCSTDLEPRDIIRQAAGVVEVYEPWIKILSSLRPRGVHGSMFSEGGPKPTLICVPFDWRKPVEEAAERLAKAVTRAHELHGDDAVIHIAAHSLGGLVSRYFLQSGKFDARAGFGQVAQLLTFGTPHRGAPVALAGAVGLHKAQFLNAGQTQALANDDRYPSLYQLFPFEGSSTIWDRSVGGRLAPLDVFSDRAFAAKLGLNTKSLDAAASFHAALQGAWPKLRRFLFVGTRYATPTHFLWDGARLQVVETDDGGDKAVPLHCSVVEHEQIRFTDKSHGAILESDQAKWALQDIFNAEGVLAISAETVVELSLAETVAESRRPIELVLTVKGPGAGLEGTLYLERARPAPGAETVAETDFTTFREYARRIDYSGPDLTSLHVKLEGVVGPAIFRPAFETTEERPRVFRGAAFVVKAPTE